MIDADQVQRLVDGEDIRQLVARYNLAIDGRDEAAYMDCWVEAGGHAERRGTPLSVTGTAQLRSLVRDFPVHGRHMSTDLIIQFDGDGAAVRHNLLYLDMAPPCAIGMVGIWNDKVVRTAKGWKFKERIFDPLTIRPSETSPEFFDAIETIKNGG